MPWTPVLNNQPLDACLRAKLLFDGEEVPSGRVEAQVPWTKAALWPVLEKSPRYANAMWDCIRAIWRLKEADDGESRDEVLEDHLEAWLVSEE